MGDYGKPTAGSGACTLVVNGIFAYFFYIYTFQNPDSGSCFAKEGNEAGYGEVPSVTSSEGDTPQEGFIDVSAKFHTWFLYGFILNCVGMGYAVFAFLYHVTESDIVKGFTNLVGCVNCCGGLAWIIAGAVFRWRFVGKVCSGDFVAEDLAVAKSEPYAWKTGKFMKIYLLLTLSILGTICCCGAVAGIAMGATAARS